MPFDPRIPRPLTSVAVQAFAPAASGVYGISNAREWIYIGEADNLRAALLAHLQEVETALIRLRPTGFVFEICEQATRLTRQDRLVVEYAPICNRRV